MLRVHVVSREVMSLLGACRVTPPVDAATKKSMTSFRASVSSCVAPHDGQARTTPS